MRFPLVLTGPHHACNRAACYQAVAMHTQEALTKFVLDLHQRLVQQVIPLPRPRSDILLLGA